MADIKVAIADDHKLFRRGVISSLKHFTNIRFVWEAENGQDVMDKLSHFDEKPDVILLDLRMPIKDGIATTKEIHEHYPKIYILILTMQEGEDDIIQLMEMGANGYLFKTSEPEEIKKAIVEVMHSHYYLTNFINRVLLKNEQHKNTLSLQPQKLQITEREKEVLTHICHQRTSAEIGKELNISPRTVESVKERLMEKCGLKNTIGLVIFAIKNNLIDLNNF